MNIRTCLRLLFTMVLLGLGLTNPKNPIDAYLTFLLTAYIAFIAFILPQLPQKRSLVMLPILIIFTLASLNNSGKVRTFLRSEPQNFTFRTDMDDYLKTLYLMKQGLPYYESYKLAVEFNPFKGVVSKNLWAWRLPTIFYIWQAFTGKTAEGVFFVFLIFCLITLYLSFKIGQASLSPAQEKMAIFMPYLLYPYLHFAARDPTLLQSEWWGIFFAIAGIYFFVHSHFKRAAGSFIFMCLIRELFVIPLIIAGMFHLVFKRKFPWLFTVPIIVFFVALFLHGNMVGQMTGLTSQFLTPRLHTLGKEILLPTLSFGSWEYFFYKIRVLLIFYILACVGLLLQWRRNYIFFSFMLLAPCILFIGTSVYNDYWGVLYMPFALISTPFIFKYL